MLSPADRFEMTATMQLALAANSPVYLRMGKSDRGDVHAGPIQFKASKLIQVRKGSARLAFIATGSMVKTAIQLAQGELEAEVWSAPVIKPLDAATLEQIAARVDCIVTLEEHSVMGGLGSCVAEAISQKFPVPICRIGVEDRFSAACGTWDYLLQEHGLDLAAVKNRVAGFLDNIGRARSRR